MASSIPFSLGIGLQRSHFSNPSTETPLDVYYPLLLTSHSDSTPQSSANNALFHHLYNGIRTLHSQIEPPHPELLPLTPAFVNALITHLKTFSQPPERPHPSPPRELTPLITPATPAAIIQTLLSILPLIEKVENDKKSPPQPNLNPYHHYRWFLSLLASPKAPPTSLADIYHRLTLISTRKALPHDLDLTNIFAILPTIAWTNQGPLLAEDIEAYRLSQALSTPPLLITHVDKFPYLVNYHIPSGVRISDGARVRLGAYLGEGSTVMPAGYVNFNAGSKGSAMIEGRISAGVVVGAESDLGGGSSVMGTLSGGGKELITIAPKCLIGANAGTGISLGFGTTIAAGVYVTAGAKVHLRTADDKPCDLTGTVVADGNNIVKALSLSGREKLLFYTESHTGKLICKPNPKSVELNAMLHQN